MATPPTKFTNLVYNLYYKKYRQSSLWFFVVCLFLGMGLYYFFTVVWPSLKTKHTKEDTTDVPNANRRGNPVSVFFFNADWCGHCTKAKPEWGSFVDKYDGQVLGKYTIECVGGKTGTNCTNDKDPNVQDAIQHYNIDHYPTVLLKKDGEVIHYDGPVTQQTLTQFIQGVVA